jgi:Xaa-Pro aminopeptidase
MQHVCTEMLKEGVLWDDVHLTAHEIAIEGLIKLGILQGAKDDILKTRTSVAFFPHGLGHYLGMDTHDTGGHPDYEDKDPMFRYLRVRGTLPAGAIITVEPGVSPPLHFHAWKETANCNLDLFLPIHHRALSQRSGSCGIHQFRCIE